MVAYAAQRGARASLHPILAISPSLGGVEVGAWRRQGGDCLLLAASGKGKTENAQGGRGRSRAVFVFPMPLIRFPIFGLTRYAL